MALKDSFNVDGRMGVTNLAQIDDTQTWKLNDCLEFQTDNGIVECVYLKAGSGGTVAGNLCTMQDGTATKTSTSADASKPLCVAFNVMTANQFGWFAVKGTLPLLSAATTSVGARVFLGGSAGVATPTATVGKAILNAVYAEAVTFSSGTSLALATIQHPTEEAPNS